MKRIIVFGNSASGKSTLAKKLSLIHSLAHLDLDTLAWQENTKSPTRRDVNESLALMNAFTQEHEEWVIEGCYGDLLGLIKDQANEAYFLDLPVALCVENAKKRPWEPHKYDSKQAQDANLSMLIDWIKAYDTRDDSFSNQAHQALYDDFTGEKNRLVSHA